MAPKTHEDQAATPQGLLSIQDRLDEYQRKIAAITIIGAIRSDDEPIADVLDLTLTLVTTKMVHIKVAIDELASMVVATRIWHHHALILELMNRANSMLAVLSGIGRGIDNLLGELLEKETGADLPEREPGADS